MADQGSAAAETKIVIAPAPEPPPLIAASPPRERKQPSVLRLLFVYLFIVFVGGALIAPRFYATAQFLEEISRRFSWLANQPFHQYVNRSIILLAILGLPRLFKALGLRSAATLGLKWGWRHFVEGVQGFAWGFAVLAFMTALLVGCDVRALDLDHDSARWLRHLKSAAFTAISVAILEELLFRGALFGALRRVHRFWFAALLSGGIYALLHFLEKPQDPRFIEWNSGLLVLARMFRGFTDFQTLVPAFFNLALLGILFALGFERTGALHFTIGLHAGLIFWLKSFSLVTNPTLEGVSTFWGSEKLIDGWATGLLLLLTFVLLERTLPPRKPAES